MERYNRAAGAALAPSAPAAPTNKYFTEGNPGGGVAATQPGPWWFHMMTEEIRKVITDAGLTPDHTDLTQLSAAISALVSGGMQRISASVASNALTLNYLGGKLDFRSVTLSSGTVNSRAITANSIVVPSGATLGMANGVAARLWLAEIDNGGTCELAVINTQLGNGQIAPVNEGALISTTVLDAASDSAGVWYSTTARSSMPFRLVGYVEISEATAGTWATAPSVIQGMGPGVARPGQELQRIQVKKTSVFTFTGVGTTAYTDITGLSITATLSGSMNVCEVESHLQIGTNTSFEGDALIVRNGTAITIADAAGSRQQSLTSSSTADGTAMIPHEIMLMDSPNNTAVTYKAQIWSEGTSLIAVNASYNDSNVSNISRAVSTISMKEIMV